ncbi:MAG: hypothetical protein NC115_08905 [Bacteroidales bacterium]|nr:hypothetical protein [Bacteroidales bacterium]
MLKKSIALGADIHFLRSPDDYGLLEEAIYQFGCDNGQNLAYPVDGMSEHLADDEKVLCEFIDVLSENGYNFNRIFDDMGADCAEKGTSTFYVVTIWGWSPVIAEKMLQKGMRPHYTSYGIPDVDEIIYKACMQSPVLEDCLLSILDIVYKYCPECRAESDETCR